MTKAWLVDEIHFKTPNRPGTLAKICGSLGKEGINISAMTAWGEEENGYFSVIADNSDKAFDVIAALGFMPGRKKIVCVELSNKPGEGICMIDVLAHNGLGINYWYCSNSGSSPTTWVYFSSSDNKRAVDLLTHG